MSEVGRFLAILDPHERAIVESLDAFIMTCVPDAVARARFGWRSLNYHAPGRGFFCALFAARSHVQLVFEQGAALPDPQGVLEGDMQRMRLITVSDERRLPRRAVRALLRQARAQQPLPYGGKSRVSARRGTPRAAAPTRPASRRKPRG